MSLTPPRSLSPSKVGAFKDCALAFRFSAIDRIPEAPSPAATKGTLVHAALERLMLLDGPQRTMDAALAALAEASTVIRQDPEFVDLHLDPVAERTFFDEAETLVRRYFDVEDPTVVRPIGLELMLSTEIDGLTVRGIIDRLELDQDGELVVTDYKTGRSPNEHYEQSRLGGVQFYAFLCEQVLGRRPARIQLMYLADGVTIVTEPDEQTTRALRTKVSAIWSAVELACEREDFRPRPGPLCSWCSFQAWCPAFGGDPAAAPRSIEQVHEAATDATAVGVAVGAVA